MDSDDTTDDRNGWNLMTRKPKKRGPPPERVKIIGDWQKAIGAALKKPPMPKKRSRKGWPKGG